MGTGVSPKRIATGKLNLVYECLLETFGFSLEASPLMQPVIHPFAGKQAFRSFLNPILRTLLED